MCICLVCVCMCVCVHARRSVFLGVTDLDFLYIMLFADYAQDPGNPLSSHVFLCTRKYEFLFTKIYLLICQSLNFSMKF